MAFRRARFGCSLATLLLLGLTTPALAQAPDTPAEPPPDAPAASSSPRLVYWGVRLGPSFTTLSSVEPFDPTAVGAGFEPTLNFGAFVNVGLRGALSIQPEILFAARGERIHHKDAQPIVTGTGTKPPRADRVVLVRYLEVPVLIRASKQTRETTSVFVIAGPALGFRRSAVVRQVNDPGKFTDVATIVGGSNLSLVYGGGIAHKRWMADARFTRGIRNITPAAAGTGASAVKTSAFTVLIGVRI